MCFLHPMLLAKIFKMACEMHVIQYFKENNNSNNNKNNNGTVENKGEGKIRIRKRSYGNRGHTKSVHQGLVPLPSFVLKRLSKSLGIMLVNTTCLISP